MMSNGFITSASLQKRQGADINDTDLHVEDQLLGGAAYDDDNVVSIWIAASGEYLHFTRDQAAALVEAIVEVTTRYPKIKENG